MKSAIVTREEKMGNMCPAQENAMEEAFVVSEGASIQDYDVVDSDGKLITGTEKANLRDFTTVKVLGQGSFGKVYLVRKNGTNNLFAMKMLKKEFLKARNQISHTKSERQILAGSECPFIVKLFYAFQTQERLYMVLEYMQGGEMFFHLQRERRFKEDRCRFYCAELVLALGYLHSKGIIYRDMKPENILLDLKGHVKLADFGLSKEGLIDNEKAYTFCGTPEYICPEILKGLGHDKGVDWWSLGILLYEMLTGRPPFYSSDRMVMFRNVLEKKPEMLPYFSPEACDLISKLLIHDPKERLGANGAEEVKSHPFFTGIDWKKLENLEVTPPFVPKVAGGYDVSYFDKQFTDQSAAETLPRTTNLLAEEESDEEEDETFCDFTFVPSGGTQGF